MTETNELLQLSQAGTWAPGYNHCHLPSSPRKQMFGRPLLAPNQVWHKALAFEDFNQGRSAFILHPIRECNELTAPQSIDDIQHPENVLKGKTFWMTLRVKQATVFE
eukprot:m.268301 g.268301  ORF g.268301 m.268301 type:complete len:107 (+) comp19734_c0_seq30:264-584(+)